MRYNLCKTFMLVLSLCLWGATGCDEADFRFDDPARGPGSMVGGGAKVSDGNFPGGNDTLPDPLVVNQMPDDSRPPDCGPSCESYCRAVNLDNPVNRGLCKSLWGVGLRHQPVVRAEACRRLYVDIFGRFPTREEVLNTCDGKTWGEVAMTLINSEAFVKVNQRKWSDRLRYDTQAVSIERIYDMDKLVGTLYRGEITYDQFAAIVSTHPVITRRYATAEDRADAVFWMFMGRPPMANERADIGRLYNIWYNGYFDHPNLDMRLPDAHIQFTCVDENGDISDQTRGQCTSVLYGYNELIIQPDIRAQVNEDGRLTMWSGLLRAEEWAELQLPGKLLTRQQQFWERAVDEVVEQYLGYRLGQLVPSVRDELVRYFLEYNGDIRALHYAVVTSAAYLQSATGQTPTSYRWTFGPSRQVDAEVWVDTIKHTLGYELATCDHRLTRPEEFLGNSSIASVALLERSNWIVTEDGSVDLGYRNLVRGLGGCPDHSFGGRFRLVSILTTATQLNFVNQVCDPGFEGTGAAVERLLPEGVSPRSDLTAELAREIYVHQTGLFYGRSATDEELASLPTYSEQCRNCSAAQFARPTCFALLTSSEMLFY